MRSTLIIIFLAILSISKGIEAPGYIITNTNDTIKANIKIPTGFMDDAIQYTRFQGVIKYVVDGKTKKLKPDDAKEVSLVYKGEQIRMVSKPFNMIGTTTINLSKQKNIFLRQFIDGKAKVFGYYYSQSSGMGTTQNPGRVTAKTDLYVQKNNGNFYRPSVFSFKEDMANYFSDCEAILTDLKNGEYGSNLEMIVNDYNKKCHD